MNNIETINNSYNSDNLGITNFLSRTQVKIYITMMIETMMLIAIITCLIIYSPNELNKKVVGYLIFLTIYIPLYRSITLIRAILEKLSKDSVSPKLLLVLDINGRMDFINTFVMATGFFIGISYKGGSPLSLLEFLVVALNACITLALIYHGIVFYHPDGLPLRNPNYIYKTKKIKKRVEQYGKMITKGVIRLGTESEIKPPMIDEQLSKQLSKQVSKQVSDDNNKVCLVCLEFYKKNEELLILECNHIFHKYCIKSWLKIKDFCPNCKQAASKKN